MNIGIITTSRADFGIYLPLIKAIEAQNDMNYLVFAGGMHTSDTFGNSYKLIESNGVHISEKLKTLYDGDTPEDIARSMGKTLECYAKIWNKYKSELDVVFVLGDRFEMFSAAASITPFNIPLAHLHGGETTLGAIDNKYRHAITCMSEYHFTSNILHAQKVAQIIGSEKNIYNVGALGIDSVLNMPLFAEDEFLEKFEFDITEAYFLVTYHPETVNLGSNESSIDSLINALKESNTKTLCTLPNADTEGKIIREKFLSFEKSNPEKIKCFENLGQKGYLTAMKHCKIMVGNTSSGIIESVAFNKPVVNIGDRQLGRRSSDNVIHVKSDLHSITQGIKSAIELIGQKFEQIYGGGNSASTIIEILKQWK